MATSIERQRIPSGGLLAADVVVGTDRGRVDAQEPRHADATAALVPVAADTNWLHDRIGMESGAPAWRRGVDRWPRHTAVGAVDQPGLCAGVVPFPHGVAR